MERRRQFFSAQGDHPVGGFSRGPKQAEEAVVGANVHHQAAFGGQPVDVQAELVFIHASKRQEGVANIGGG